MNRFYEFPMNRHINFRVAALDDARNSSLDFFSRFSQLLSGILLVFDRYLVIGCASLSSSLGDSQQVNNFTKVVLNVGTARASEAVLNSL